LNGRPSIPARLYADRDRDDEEDRQEEEQRDRADDEVEHPLQKERRARDVPGRVLDDGEVGDVVQAHGGAEHPARGRDDAQLDALVAAELEQVGEQRLVDRLRGDDDPVDVEARDRIDLLHLVDHLHVDVGEELELAPGRVGERADPDDQRPLAWNEPPPQPAREAAQHDGERDRDAPAAQRGGDPGRAGGGDREEQRQRRGRGERPDEDRRELVHGQVPQGALIAVVEAGELREEDPGGREHGRPERVDERSAGEERERAGDEERGR
jgi:hypothetical protein